MQTDDKDIGHLASGLGEDAARIEAELSINTPSHDPFSSAVRATRMPMVVTNPRLPDNPIVFVNDSFCRLTGYAREEIVGRNCRFLQGPDTPAEQVDAIRAAINEVRSIEIDIRNRRRDGTPFWNRLLLAPVHDEAGQLTYFFASQLDVTLERERLADLEAQNAVLAAERLVVANQLALSQASLGLAIDAAEIGTWDLDLVTNVLNWSRRTRAMFGIAPDARCSSMDDFYAGLHPDDLAHTSEAFASALDPDRRTIYDVEYRTIGKEDGLVRWVAAKGRGIFDDQGRCVRAIGTAIDVSSRKEVEQRLRASDTAMRELNATLEQRVAARTRERDRAWQLSQDLLVTARPDGVLDSVNARWTELLGWGRDELIGKTFMELTHPDDLEATHAAFIDIFEGPLTRPYEYRLRCKSGDYRWFGWTGAFENGHVYATGRDVTAEKEQAAALEAAQDALRQSQKMEAVGQLTGGLAHDFNNLLTGIMGNLELLQSRVAAGRFDSIDRFVNAAQGAGRRAAALTHRLLAFSRRQTLDPKPTDVNRLIAGMEELIRRSVGPAIDIEVVGAAGLWPALIDPGQLENALLNLAINARDAMPDGGRLTIETANKWLDGRSGRARDLPPGQYLSVCVSDTGTGMTPEVIARAFDPFYTTKPLGEGTGLGLSMIYGFARQSGGQVRIYSEVGKGTTMCIYLPRHTGDDPDDAGPSEGEDALDAARGETILVVDDEPTIRHLIDEVLDELGYTVIGAADGAAGLKVLQSGARIELLITDVGLPGGMNGRQVADAARSLRPGLKVLFITGYAENAAIGNGHLDPGMELLTKPFTLEDLARRVRDLIAKPV
ncbi:MAG TPA: PAS domain-containing protein [Sphingomonas sp.]|jgi:PAS domain S-box-containing protein